MEYKLAVDLATRFNGEIINGDAMQMYRGLPIITNQIPLDERNNIPHHLIDCVGLEEEPWRVGLFRKECLRLIDEIHNRGKLPILVGGTHYYTNSVLFHGALVRSEEEGSNPEELEKDDTDATIDPAERWPILNAPPEVMLQKLKDVDPIMAQRWHPKDDRKIRRSLEIYFQTGKPASQIYANQKRQKQEAAKYLENDQNDSIDRVGQMRYTTLLFWTHATREALNERLNTRVDSMIEQGLITEAERMSEFLKTKSSQGVHVDKTRGVWIAIGYKEFEPYFEAIQSGAVNAQGLEALKWECIERVKISTRQYATRQLKWIRNKLYRALGDAKSTGNFFILDTTDVEEWETSVQEPSENITQTFLEGGDCPAPRTLSVLAQETLSNIEREYLKNSAIEQDPSMTKQMTCDRCNKTMYGQEQWQSHIRSRNHKKALAWSTKKVQPRDSLRTQTSHGMPAILSAGKEEDENLRMATDHG